MKQCERCVQPITKKSEHGWMLCPLEPRTLLNKNEWSRSASLELSTHAKDVLQPLKKDGTINKHFVEAHGTQSLQKELKLSEREIHANIERYG